MRISTPQLIWAGKAEHTSFEVPTVSVHVHERIEPRTIIETVRRRNGNGNALAPFSACFLPRPKRITHCGKRLSFTNIRMAGRTE